MKKCPDCDGSGNDTVKDEAGNVQTIDVGSECEGCLGAGRINDDGNPLSSYQVKKFVKELEEQGLEVGEIHIFEDEKETQEVPKLPTRVKILLNAIYYTVLLMIGAVATTLLNLLVPTIVQLNWVTLLAGAAFAVVMAWYFRVVGVGP